MPDLSMSDIPTKAKVAHMWRLVIGGLVLGGNCFVGMVVYSYHLNQKQVITQELRPIIEGLKTDIQKELNIKQQLVDLEIANLRTRITTLEAIAERNRNAIEENQRALMEKLHNLELLIAKRP